MKNQIQLKIMMMANQVKKDAHISGSIRNNDDKKDLWGRVQNLHQTA